MIFETLAAMADRANDNKDNFNSTFQQTKAVLQDVDNDGLNGKGPKQLINFGTKSGNCPMHGKEGEYKHYLVGMQQKQPQSVIQRNVDSSSSSSLSSSSSSSSQSIPVSTCPGGLPEMRITVTGTAQSTISWCGQTWNLPADSGQERTICPDRYIDGTTTFSDIMHRWRASGTDGARLSFRRAIDRYNSITYNVENRMHLRVLAPTISGVPGYGYVSAYILHRLLSGGPTTQGFLNDQWHWGGSSGFFSRDASTATGWNAMWYVGFPTTGDFHIPAPARLGSYTAPDGTVFSWTSGNGW